MKKFIPSKKSIRVSRNVHNSSDIGTRSSAMIWSTTMFNMFPKSGGMSMESF